MLVESVTVGPETVEAVVRFAALEPLRTSEVPMLAERVLRLMPGLRSHRCFNDDGLPLRDEIADTEIAHLLEHAALEVMAMAGSPDTLRGDTSWDFARDGHGVFHVRLQYDDDLVALGAMKLAAEALEWCAGGEGEGGAPDVEAGARELRRLRAR